MNLNAQEVRALTEFHRQAVESACKYRREDDPRYQAWCTAKRITWMILLAASFLFFYLIARMHEALTLL
jgi:hypothetical protein